jgi:hypothetical protein
MKKTILIVAAISVFSLTMIGCSFSVGTNMDSPAANTAKSNSSPANTAAKSNSNSKTEKSQTVLKNEEKPKDGNQKKAKEVPVPSNWVYVYDESKGYGFYVPDGTTGESKTIEGFDVFMARTPEPNEVGIFVLAYNDKTKTKEDLLKDAVEFMEGMGLKVTPGELKAESDDYAVADSSSVAADGTKGKQRILVGTDVTDNYVMILGTEADKFAANEKTIDEIWGNFEMWSGGASGGN